MCDILIGEIQEGKLEASHLPHNLCTHMLFKIRLENYTVPNTLKYGKKYSSPLFANI
jgi:hypothetical protein